MIAVIDYGLGNIHSVLGALKKLEYEAILTNKLEEIEKADKLILPGVGAFADGMKNLESLDLIKILTKIVMKDKKPILGICLGFQLMAKESSEFGNHKGLGWIDASVKKLQPKNKERVPHVGWDDLQQTKSSPLYKDIPKDALFYYVHSFKMESNIKSDIIGECDYGGKFTAAVERENIFGTQFHPEKSQKDGLILLKNYLKC